MLISLLRPVCISLLIGAVEIINGGIESLLKEIFAIIKINIAKMGLTLIDFIFYSLIFIIYILYYFPQLNKRD